MRTVVETPTFSKLADDHWSDSDRLEFVAWLAANPDAGAIVVGTGGVRKVRWSRAGNGKRGGVRVIYFHRTEREELWLLLIYARSNKENIPAHVLGEIREAIER